MSDEDDGGAVDTILHVVPSLDIRQGGPVSFLASLLETETIPGRHIVAAGMPRKGGEPRSLPEGVRLLLATHGPLYAGLRVTLNLFRGIKSSDVLIIHSFFNWPSLVSLFLGRVWRRPTVLVAHGSLGRSDLQKHARAKRLLLPLWRSALQGSHVVTTTSSEAEELVPFGACVRQTTITPPVNVTIRRRIPLTKRHDSLDGRLQFLFAGRFHPVKNIEAMLIGFALFNARKVHALHIIGSGEAEYRDEIKRQVSDLLLAGHEIVVSEWKPQEEIHEALATSDAVILASHSENFGMVAAEALGVGTPVILTPTVPLAPLVRQHCAGVVSSGASSAALSSAMLEFASHESKHWTAGIQALQSQYLDLAQTRRAWTRLLADERARHR